MAALVTGATGFLGSHLVERLVREGCEVRCLVRPASDRRWLAAVEGRVRLVEGDLDAGAAAPGGDAAGREAEAEAALAAGLAGVDVIFHLGGLTRRTKKPREAFYRVNERGTDRLAAAAARAAPGLRRLVYASTLAAVGPSRDGRPLDEDTPPRPLTDYGASKRAGEVALAARADAVRSAIVRLPGLYGPRDENTVQLFRAVARGLYPAGRRRVSLLHADDACAALIAAARADDLPSGRVFHVSAPAVTVSGLGRAAARAAGRRALPLLTPAPLVRAAAWASEAAARLTGRPGFLDREKAKELTGDWPCAVERARRELGWEARVPLDQGLRDLYAWYRSEGWL